MITSETASPYKGKHVYDVAIDNAMINILKNTENETSGQLKVDVEKKIRRTISPYTFSTHISNLINKKIIVKKDLGRGSNIFYSLTEIAGKKFELGLLGTDKSIIELFRRIYNAIFIYHAFYYYPKIVFSDPEFREFLTKIGAKENELIWSLISNGHNHESVEIAYGRRKESLHMRNTPIERYNRICKEYWKERSGQARVLEDIQLTCYPLMDNLDSFYIDRFEHWEINKKSPNRILLTEYHLGLCGFSVDDIMEVSGVDRDNVSQAIDNLKRLKLIEPIIFFDGEPKYRFKERELEGLFAAIWDIHAKAEILLLLKKWCYKDKPILDELDRLERLVGKEERQRIEMLCERIRMQMKLALRQSKTIHQFINYIKENVSFFWKLLEYPYETPDTFAEYIAYLQDYKLSPYRKEIPPRLRQIFSKYGRFKNLVPEELIRHLQARNERTKEDPLLFLYSTVESFGRNKDKVSVHTSKNEVADFYRYFQYMLDKRLENPGYNDEYIEDIKIQFKDVIMKYPFLEDIINDVCPSVLHTQNKEEEQELIYIVREKIGNEITTREIIDESEIHDFEANLKSGAAFHYDTQETFNPLTQEIEYRKIFHLLNQKEIDSCKFSEVHIIEKVYNPKTRRVEDVPVIHFLDGNKNHTTKRKIKKSRNN